MPDSRDTVEKTDKKPKSDNTVGVNVGDGATITETNEARVDTAGNNEVVRELPANFDPDRKGDAYIVKDWNIVWDKPGPQNTIEKTLRFGEGSIIYDDGSDDMLPHSEIVSMEKQGFIEKISG